nr:hypothetical protein [Tanacetum cinerariifolium]
MKMFDNGTKDEYAVKLSGIASKSVTLGEVMSKHKLVKKFLTSLPRHFVHIVAAVEQVLDLKMTGFEDVRRKRTWLLEVMDEVEVKDVVGETRKTNVNVTPRKNVKIISKSIRGEFLTMRDSWGSLLIKVSRSVNRLYKAQLKLGKEGTNEVGRESDKKKVPNGEFIIVAVYGDDIFVTDASLDLINVFKKRMSSQFEMSNLGELTYYLGIEVSRGKDCIEIKQERYAMKILKEAGMEDCNATLCPMEPKLKFLKAKDEPEVETTQYQKMVGCLRFLLHTRLDLTYSVGVVSRCMQSPRESHARAIKQILRYLKVIMLTMMMDEALLDMFFYLGTSPITWCSQKKTIVALSSCEVEFMAATAAACQAIWLRELLVEVTGLE